MKNRKLYCMFTFSKEGYLRGFENGYPEIDIKNSMFEEAMNGNICLVADDYKFSRIPSKFIESHYWKVSTNKDDFETISKILE